MQFNFKKFFSKKEKEERIIIVGLGNPGPKYQNTYHNVGYKVVDALASKLSIKVKRAECSSLTGTYSKNNLRVILAKPTTYMNLSGQAVKSLVCKYNATFDDVIIVFDDIDLNRFNIRARHAGSAGTHKGMRNIIELAKSDMIKRIRIGIGREQKELKNFVLSAIKKEDAENFSKCFDRVTFALQDYFVNKDFDKLMRTLNSRVGDEV